MVLQVHDISIWEVETGRSEIQGHSGLQNEFKADPGYIYTKYVFKQECT